MLFFTSALLCSTTCGASDVAAPYSGACDLPTRQSGGTYLAFVKCDYQFTNILDPAEWEAAILNNDIHITPRGDWTLPAPTVTTENITGCGVILETSRTYSIPFTTWAATTDGSDFDYWDVVTENYTDWRVIPISCDGIFYMSDEFYAATKATPAGPATSAGNSAGLKYSFSVAPYENREGNIDTLVNFQMTVDLKKRGLLKGCLLPGVLPVLA